MEPPKMTSTSTLGKLGYYREVPFFGSFGGLGHCYGSPGNSSKTELLYGNGAGDQ